MKIALSGYYGFDNAGDEALLSAITSSIKRLRPSADFVVFSGSPEKTSALHGIRAVYHKNPWQVFHELLEADLLISGGGSIFQDVTSARSLPYYISVVALARLVGKPVIFYAQGVGPINRRLSKFLMRLIGNRVNLITLRDEDSRQFLWDLGVTRPPLLVTADPVFSLEPGPADQAKIEHLLKNIRSGDKPLVGVAVRKWQALEGYQERLAKLLDELVSRGYQILFIPMAYPDDVNESRRVAKLMKEDAYVLDEHLGSQEHLALISRLDLMVAMRLHALIFSASRGIPFAGISYDPKVDAFLKLFNLQPLSTGYKEMQAQIDTLLGDVNLQDKISTQAQEMRRKSEQNARLALSLVKKS
ncbi:MAG: polysaccharide pyruvyl transferase CsaB [Firmicutes bacterium HGW-Firmicutes-15]|nr:MAG: polysaccharide pyruvyl transferase CsaB [Firmicutes bacterium HGW-Firmicutes-15]